MEYDVLKEGNVLLPGVMFCNEAGLEVFGSDDLDPAWRGRPRPVGRWMSACTVPGNLLSEGTLFVTAALVKLDPLAMEFSVPGAVGFQVVDNMHGDSARGDWSLHIGGVVRPLLEWRTEFEGEK
jgi:lipopolysaccharide transport system ATP-binding protein